MTDGLAIDLVATDKRDAPEWTPVEIRQVLAKLARGQIDEQAARPAIDALNRITRDALRRPARPPQPEAVERRSLR